MEAKQRHMNRNGAPKVLEREVEKLQRWHSVLLPFGSETHLVSSSERREGTVREGESDLLL